MKLQWLASSLVMIMNYITLVEIKENNGMPVIYLDITLNDNISSFFSLI